MKINNTNGINFPNDNGKKKDINNNPSQNEQKSAQANSLDALSAYGRAQVNMPSFKGNIENIKDLFICPSLPPIFELDIQDEPDIPDEEFERNKQIYEEIINKLPEEIYKIFSEIKSVLNKYNIQLAIKLLAEDNSQNKETSLDNEKAWLVISKTDTKEKLQLANKILSDERLYNNENVMNQAEYIIGGTLTYEQAQAKRDIIDKILSDERLYYNENVMKNIGNIICNTKTPEQYELANKILSDERLYNNEIVMNKAERIIYCTETPEQVQIANKILSDERLYNNENVMKNVSNIISYKQAENMCKALTSENIQKVEYQREIVLKNPEMYVNGQNNSTEIINNFFGKNYHKLLLISDIFDNETINTLLRMRFEEAKDYLDTLYNMSQNNANLVKGLSASKNTENKPFQPSEKIEFIDLIEAYRKINLDTKIIEDMIATGKVDTQKLNRNLFGQILKNIGLTDDEINRIPSDKLNSWDIKYIHLLAQEIDSSHEEETFNDLLIAANLYDFNEYILDNSNEYGQTNAKTKKLFEKQGLNYDSWLKPSSQNNVIFTSKDKNTEKLAQISSQLIEDIEALRNTPAKGFVDKQIKDYIQNGKLVIPNEITNNKENLLSFTQNLLHLFEAMFKRAEGNLSNPDKAQSAQNTLTIKSHLEQRLDDISNVTDEQNKTNNLDLTIKMWDRIPQKDLFQGNYSTCCIGMNAVNGSAMPHYLMDTVFNMIEIVDNTTGKTIGNALCYFITQSKRKPAFIIDNIEINNARKPSEEVGRKLRNAIVEYASNVSKGVTGNDYTPIFMGDEYNDVPTDDLNKVNDRVSLSGYTDCDEIYMDLYGGWVDDDQYTKILSMLKLR